jgi:flavin reductase (DIM6/NTAB) family NADH-FMN oxidoreductase RutF
VPLTTAEFRRAMGSLASGVCLVTVRGEGGEWFGMTATSVTSLSLAPPLLLVCVGHESVLHDTIAGAAAFGVVMLGRDQAALAERYATRGRQRFDAPQAMTPAGLPLVAGALAVIDCRRTAVLEGGDHSIVVGSLEWAATQPGEPLLHFRGAYAGLA